MKKGETIELALPAATASLHLTPNRKAGIWTEVGTATEVVRDRDAIINGRFRHRKEKVIDVALALDLIDGILRIALTALTSSKETETTSMRSRFRTKKKRSGI